MAGIIKKIKASRNILLITSSSLLARAKMCMILKLFINSFGKSLLLGIYSFCENLNSNVICCGGVMMEGILEAVCCTARSITLNVL